MKKQNNQQGYRYRNRRNRSFSGRNSLITTIISGIVGVVIKDISSENSKIKGLLQHFFKPKQLESESTKQVIETEYSVIEEEDSQIKEIKEENKHQIGEKK